MRGVWTAAMLIGIAVFGGLAVLFLYGLYFDPEAPVDGQRLRAIEWPLTFAAIACACGVGLFISRRALDDATKQEVDEDPAQWIKDMRARNADKDDV